MINRYILWVLTLTLILSTVTALDFSVSCPSQVNVGQSFDCTVAMSNPGSVGLQGLSFTVDTGGATVSSVTFASSLTDVSSGGTYAFAAFGAPFTGTDNFATIRVTPQSGQTSLTVLLNGRRGSTTDGSNTQSLDSSTINFLQQPSVTIGSATPPACTAAAWSCSGWSACSSGSQTRTCSLVDTRCSNSASVKPAENQACSTESNTGRTALDFSVSCPSQVNVGQSFDCTVAMSNPGSVGLQGLSFTVDTGGATVSSVTFASSLTDVSSGGTYAFAAFGAPFTGTDNFATIRVTPQSGQTSLTVLLNGRRGSTTDGSNTQSLDSSTINFLQQPSVTIGSATPPACTAAAWSCGDWSSCDLNRQTRNCLLVDESCSNPVAVRPLGSRSCTTGPVCTPNEWACEGPNQQKKCNPDGTDYNAPQGCPAGFICTSGSCQPSRSCTEREIIDTNGDGTPDCVCQDDSDNVDGKCTRLLTDIKESIENSGWSITQKFSRIAEVLGKFLGLLS